jgi:isocitrate lyase
MDKLKKTTRGYKIIASGGDWVEGYKNNTVAKVTNTGNGYIFKFHSYSSVHQDQYVCLDYSQAAFMLRLLREYADDLQ